MPAQAEGGVLPANSSDSAVVGTLTLWWPIEVVHLQVEVVEPRKLTALEWALLRVMDEFRDDPPPLSEIVEELGLDDPEFLRDTLRDIVRLRALKPRDGVSAEFSGLVFTELGERLYRKGQIEAEPSTHGVKFFIDALTDEDLPEPVGHQQWAQERFLEDMVGDPRDSLGLERLRSGMRRFYPDILKGDAEVRAVRTCNESVFVDAPAVHWRPVKVHLNLSVTGELSVEPQGLTKKARDFLLSRDLEEDGVLPTHPVTENWGETTLPRCSTNAAFSTWCRSITKVVPIAKVEARASKLLKEAKTEIVLHICWGGLAGLVDDLREATDRGVRVLLIGTQETTIFAWEGRTGIGLEVEINEPAMGALVVDRTRGLLIDDVKVKVNDQLVVIELAGILRDLTAAAYRDELVNTALASQPSLQAIMVAEPTLTGLPLEMVDAKVNGVLADDRVRLALARLAFSPVKAEATTLIQLVASLAPGVERIPLMRSLVASAREYAPALTTQFEQAWTGAWEGIVAACRRAASVPGDLVVRLAIWAPTATVADTYVDFTVAAWMKRAQDIEEGTDRLLVIANAADARWRSGVARGCRSWCEARDGVLASEDWSEENVKRRASLATRLMSQNDAHKWAVVCLAKIPLPSSLAGMELWGSRAEGLRELVGSRFEDRVAEIVSSFLNGQTYDPTRVLRFVGTLLPTMRLATILVGEPPSTHGIASVRQAFLQGGTKEIVEEDWIPMVERALPDWSGTFNAPEHADGVARLVTDLSFPTAKNVLKNWAKRIAVEIERPAKIEGVAWWLGEVSALVPALGEEVVPFALGVVRDHVVALHDARKRGTSHWHEVRDAWRSFGYGEDALNTLASESVPLVLAETTTKNPKKKGKKRR